MEIKINCPTKELLEALQRLKVVLPKGVAGKRAYLEMEIRIDEIDLKVQGATQIVNGKTEGFGKVSVPFHYLIELVKMVKEEKFSVVITDDKMECGKITVSVRTDFKAPKATRKIDLPINFASLDALRMRKSHTEEEIRSNNMFTKILEEEKLKDQRIEKAFLLLKIYNISKTELQQLVDISIYGTDAIGK